MKQSIHCAQASFWFLSLLHLYTIIPVIQCTAHSVHCTLYTVRCTLYTVRCTVYIHFTMHTIGDRDGFDTIYTMHTIDRSCKLYIV